ncbi:MAG: four helix bundle protein [Megasphaera elsdenii]|uniref:Four helix bundle protein n=1 Tax=Megasphaera elsdenii TaxID=907 RepID=A0A1M6LGH9_MEGEL|nr:four helix bundle protein [Megasphaera elsdenii]AVO27914.1 four helix bundle protein [Megasphaera elsdenii]MDY4728477.1 four helix bundle protein [Megasphaera elsdenii]SHJ70286.1 four helix bundle protein [Megasphaera elsdenii]
MPLRSFRDLIVWQKAMRLARETYCLVKLLPMEERYALSDQMRRAAVSIPSNIAEGQSRNTKKEFIQFLHIAKGSNSELMTQFLLCLDFEYLKKEEIQKVMNLCTEIDGLLGGLIKSLKTNLV